MLPQAPPTQRYPWGWYGLVAIFVLLVPTAILGSFKQSDPNSKDPGVQAGNLEAAVQAETKSDNQRIAIQRVVKALDKAHTTSEEADAVWAVAKTELKEPVTPEDLKALTTSKLERRRNLAAIYTLPKSPDLKSLVNKLPADIFLYRVAKAQTLEKFGDQSARYDVSPLLAPPKVTPILTIIAVATTLAFMLGCLGLIVYVVGMFNGQLAWRGHPVEPVSPFDADRLAARAAQLLGLFVFTSFTVGAIARAIPGEMSEMRSMAEGVAGSAAVLVLTLLLCRLPILGQTLSLADLRITKQTIGSSLAWGAAGVFAVVPVVAVGLLIGSLAERFSPRPDHPLAHLLSNSHPWWAIVGALFMASVQAPIVEEIIFRGTMLPAFSGLFRSSRYHIPLAMGLSSLLFASIHPQGFMLWLVLGGVGVVNSVLCYQIRSVLPGIFMHGMYNGALVVITLFVR